MILILQVINEALNNTKQEYGIEKFDTLLLSGGSYFEDIAEITPEIIEKLGYTDETNLDITFIHHIENKTISGIITVNYIASVDRNQVYFSVTHKYN